MMHDVCTARGGSVSETEHTVHAPAERAAAHEMSVEHACLQRIAQVTAALSHEPRLRGHAALRRAPGQAAQVLRKRLGGGCGVQELPPRPPLRAPAQLLRCCMHAACNAGQALCITGTHAAEFWGP